MTRSSEFSRGSSERVEPSAIRLHIGPVNSASKVGLIIVCVTSIVCAPVAAQVGAQLTSAGSETSQAAPPPQVSANPAVTVPGPHERQDSPSGNSAEPARAPRQLTLAAAIAQAIKTQPTMRQARAQTQAAEGRVEQARSGYLPQITGTAGYQRTTGNFATRPGAIPNTAAVRTSYSLTTTYDFFNFSLTASQLIYDFGQTSNRWGAAESAVDASAATENSTRLQTIMNVQSAFFQAWAQRALVDVAKETLSDQLRHLEQVEVSVKVGVQPEIGVATARANVANAQLQVINAQNGYEVAKDQLIGAMGLMETPDFEVADEEAPTVEGEDGPIEPLVKRALDARPDIVAFERQHESQVKTIRSLRGAYGPSLVASSAATEQGVQLNSMVPNWNVGVTLTWPIFQGGMTNGQIREAEANLQAIDAQLAALRIQIRTQIDQARLAVRAAKSSIGAADDALTNARLQLKLAEGRYSAGVGSIIELADAQVAYTTARAQVIQAHFNLSNSRAQLVTALGLR